MEKQSFNLSKVEGIPSPRGRFQLKKLTFPSPTAFFGRRGSDCRRGTSRTSTGEVRVGVKQKVAFTLAEVLITLGVIGVVAAITMPTIINNIRAYQYQSRFKKVYSNIQQAFMLMKADMGIEHLGSYYANANVDEFYTRFPSYFHVLKTFPYNHKGFTATNYTNDYTFYSENGDWTCSPFPSSNKLYILQDGSSFFPLINSEQAYITVDLNGPYKKPNRMGYDIFMFQINSSKDKIEPLKSTIYSNEDFEKLYVDAKTLSNPCSKNLNHSTNGCGCAWYALNDVNPDDSSKKYWKSLKW